MTVSVSVALAVLLAYLVGAIPFGYLVARARGVEILKQGSGNIGATNVGRVLGRRFGILVFLLDFAKGALPVAVARAISPPDIGPHVLPVVAGLAAFLGHLFPIYLRFRGGKGVATGAGVVAVLVPMPTVLALLVWAAVVCATRYVSAASLAAATALCVFQLLFSRQPFGGEDVILTVFCLVAAALVFARHRANVGRLLRGTENRLGETATMLLFTKIVHVLAMGLWFGSVIFFSFVVGLSLFSTFEHLSEKPAAERPWWLPLPPEVAKEQGPSEKFPRPLSKEQGSRIAGVAVGPMFGWYYAIQLVCGVLAVATALAWWSGGDTLSRVRIGILLAALISVGVGWWLEHKVSDLRVTRSDASDAVLTAAQASPESIVAANAARADFGRWHGYSLIVNFVTVALVLAGMVLVALLPAGAADGPAAVVKEEVVSAAHSGAE